MTDKKNAIYNIFLCVVSAAIIFLPIQKYHYLQSTFFDLGLYSNIVSNLNSDISLVYHGHFQPILFIPSFIVSQVGTGYAAYILLLIQSIVIIISGVILQRRFGKNISIIYFISPLLWTYLLFDFHVECFLVFLLVLYYKELHNANFGRAAIITLLFSLIKEVYILLAISLSAYLIILTFFKKSNVTQFFLLIGVLLLNIFLLNIVFNYILPLDSSYDGAYLNGSQYAWLGYGFLNKIVFILSHPFDIISHILSIKIFLYFLFLIAATGLFSILRLANFVPFLIILAIYLLPKDSNYINFTGHYNVVFLVPLLVCLYGAIGDYTVHLHNIKPLIRARIYICIGLIPAAITAAFFVYSQPIAPLFNIDYDHLTKKKSIIDKYACNGLLSSVQNNINYNCTYSSVRPLIFPEGVSNLKIGSNINYTAKYIIIDTSISPFVYDKSCGRIISSCTGSAIANQYNQIRTDLVVHSKLIEAYNGLEVYEQF
jgi:uncharacterized membrane protein